MLRLVFVFLLVLLFLLLDVVKTFEPLGPMSEMSLSYGILRPDLDATNGVCAEIPLAAIVADLPVAISA